MVELGGKQVEIDEDGFIQDPDVWDEAVALTWPRPRAWTSSRRPTGSS